MRLVRPNVAMYFGPPAVDLREFPSLPDEATPPIKMGDGEATDLPLKGQLFHREAENRLSRRPRDEKNSILTEF
jgi:hypothetical protein